MLDAVGLHHADPARSIPARHDLLAVGSGIRAGFRFFRTAWITRTSLWAVAKSTWACSPGPVSKRRSNLGAASGLSLLLYLNHDIGFPSPTLAKVGDGAVHGALLLVA